MAVYVTILLLVIIPNHHHEDHKEHADCIACTIAHQPLLFSVPFALPIVGVFLVINPVLPSTIPVSKTPASLQSRAPPR